MISGSPRGGDDIHPQPEEVANVAAFWAGDEAPAMSTGPSTPWTAARVPFDLIREAVDKISVQTGGPACLHAFSCFLGGQAVQ